MSKKAEIAKLIIQGMIDRTMVVDYLPEAFIIEANFLDQETAEKEFEEIAEEILKYLGVS